MAEAQAESSGFARAEQALLDRWPENRVAADLSRISALMEILGDPHRSAPVIHIAGTNGKTSTARIIESLLRAFGLSTGLFTSPALESMCDRVQINGQPVEEQRFAAAYADIEPYLRMVDAQSEAAGGPPVTMFEAITALGFACFADAPVDVMIIECGMGGSWDATNVVEPAVSVITPIGMDHTDYLGETISAIATEKAGILAAAAPAVLARQEPEAATVLLRRCAELGIAPAREGVEFAVVNRRIALGGQQLTLQGMGGEYPDLYLPLHGEHQASNAALALATVETFLGAQVPDPESGTPLVRQLNVDTVRLGMAEATSPGRLERVKSSPTVIIDAAHNAHGANAAAAALAESFDFSKIVGLVAVMADKDVVGMLRQVEPVFDQVVVTRNSSPRSLPVDDLSRLALSVFGEDRVFATPDMPNALDVAIALADQTDAYGSTAVVALGSVVTAADVRTLVKPHPAEIPDDLSELDDPGYQD